MPRPGSSRAAARRDGRLCVQRGISGEPAGQARSQACEQVRPAERRLPAVSPDPCPRCGRVACGTPLLLHVPGWLRLARRACFSRVGCASPPPAHGPVWQTETAHPPVVLAPRPLLGRPDGEVDAGWATLRGKRAMQEDTLYCAFHHEDGMDVGAFGVFDG